MGSSSTKESTETLKQDIDEDEKWVNTATALLKNYYLSFRGSQWDQYQVDTKDELLLRAKICYSIYGPPTVADAEEIWNAYKEDQIENAKGILSSILVAHSDKKSSKDKLLVGIIFVACKQDKAEYSVPIFRVFTGSDPTNPSDGCSYVDNQKRIYSSWSCWQSNNTMPELRYAYPQYGFFSCSKGCSYSYDSDEDPVIEFGYSPACNLTSSLFRSVDIIAGITSFGCGVIGIASLFTPVGPAILFYSAISGGGSALYGASRAVARVVDKSIHGESLSDLESFTLYFSIAATPLHFFTSVVNGTIVRGAIENGRIFSPTMRMFATVLNLSTLGVDGVMIGFGVVNLVEKYKRDQLNTIDVLQFSMSVFFFTNTFIQPKTATAIIKKAQESHINAYANNLNDAKTKETFNKFLDENKGSGSIKDTSKIIRTINRINDPNALFGDLKDVSSVKIGGRKGKTLLVSDQNNTVNRINPNVPPNFSTMDQPSVTQPVKIQRRAKQCLNSIDSQNIDIDGNDNKVFANMTNGQKSRANKVIGGSAENNGQIVLKAVELSRELDLKTVDEVFSTIEILVAHLQKKNSATPMKEITLDQLNAVDMAKLSSTIRDDIAIAQKIAETNKINFRDPLLAVYHYHKHGSDFPAVLRRQNIEVYLTKVPSAMVQDANLTSIQTINGPDGSVVVEKIYITPQDRFAVVLEGVDGTELSKTVKTMFMKGNAYQDHLQKSSTERKWQFDIINGIAQNITQTLGFRGMYSFFININQNRYEMIEENENKKTE